MGIKAVYRLQSLLLNKPQIKIGWLSSTEHYLAQTLGLPSFKGLMIFAAIVKCHFLKTTIIND